MARTETELSDIEWEAKFNGPRDRLLKKIFGDTPCEVKAHGEKGLKAKPEPVKQQNI